jgi:hypothetical protein
MSTNDQDHNSESMPTEHPLPTLMILPLTAGWAGCPFAFYRSSIIREQMSQGPHDQFLVCEIYYEGSKARRSRIRLMHSLELYTASTRTRRPLKPRSDLQ